jgi:hypothetical protein
VALFVVAPSDARPTLERGEAPPPARLTIRPGPSGCSSTFRYTNTIAANAWFRDCNDAPARSAKCARNRFSSAAPICDECRFPGKMNCRTHSV